MQRAISTSLAVRLFELGARLQIVEHEFPHLSRETLLELYKEVHEVSPPKGMLPFSIDWYLTWQPNVHASLFMNYYEFFKLNTTLGHVEVLIRAYDFYLQDVSRFKNHDPKHPLFSITRAWMLIKQIESTHPVLTLARCTTCGGRFIIEDKGSNFNRYFVCGMCKPPARAGRTRVTEACTS